jgi:hypothetical protein
MCWSLNELRDKRTFANAAVGGPDDVQCNTFDSGNYINILTVFCGVK